MYLFFDIKKQKRLEAASLKSYDKYFKVMNERI